MAKIKKLLVIIGSAKTGSTSLAHWLGQRDDMVLGTIKEGRYFTDFASELWSGPAADGFRKTMITDAADFELNFPGLRSDQWAIDASTDYIWAEGSITKLLSFAETCQVKVVCIVRDPVSRAVSEYNHTLRQGWETLSFNQSLIAEQSRRKAGWHPLFYHMRRSQIHDDVQRFHEAFGSNFLVLDYQDMKTAEVILEKVTKFLNLPIKSINTSKSHNVSYLEKRKFYGYLKRNRLLLSVGRLLLPAPTKRWLWNFLHVEANKKATVSEVEKKNYAFTMSSEIAACKASSQIPTDSWP